MNETKESTPTRKRPLILDAKIIDEPLAKYRCMEEAKQLLDDSAAVPIVKFELEVRYRTVQATAWVDNRCIVSAGFTLDRRIDFPKPHYLALNGFYSKEAHSPNHPIYSRLGHRLLGWTLSTLHLERFLRLNDIVALSRSGDMNGKSLRVYYEGLGFVCIEPIPGDNPEFLNPFEKRTNFCVTDDGTAMAAPVEDLLARWRALPPPSFRILEETSFQSPMRDIKHRFRRFR